MAEKLRGLHDCHHFPKEILSPAIDDKMFVVISIYGFVI